MEQQRTYDLAHFGTPVVFGMDMRGRCTLSVGPGLAAHGLEAGELVGQDLFAVYDGSDQVASLRRALAGESFTTQSQVGDRVLWTAFQPVRGRDGELGGVVGTSIDVTEHVSAVTELVTFKALVDDSHELIAIADQAGGAPYVNGRFAATGLPAPRDLWSAVAGLVGDDLAGQMRGRVEGGGRWSGEVDLMLPVGRESVALAQAFPLLDVDGTTLGAAWIAQDITALRSSEAALRATNADLAQFRALVETSGDFIAIAGLDGTVSYLNPAGRALVGLPADLDVTTTTIHDYLTPDGIKRSEQIEQPAVVAHGRWSGESTLRRPGAPPVPVQISSFLMRDAETDEPFALATVQHDITERLAAQQAQEDFITMVAHELRTPLTSVKGYVEIAGESLEEGADAARVSDHLEVAARNVARMERLVEQILDIAGERRPQPDLRLPSDLAEVVTRAVESARPLIEQTGHVLSLHTGPPLTVLLDDRFVEVVDNLVANAAKYTPPGGTLEVDVRREDGAAVLTVSDTGPGVPAGERLSIFEKFARGGDESHQSVPGLGLGLFITRGVVLAHDGEIAVGDRPGGGARFVVRLPLVEPDADGPAATA